MFCQKCGSKLPENVLFCPKCGNKVVNNQVQQASNKQSSNKKSTNKRSTNKKSINNQSSKKAVVIVWIIAIIAIVLAAVLVFMAVMKYRDGGSGNDGENVNSENNIDSDNDTGDDASVLTEDDASESADADEEDDSSESAREVVYEEDEIISYNEDGTVAGRVMFKYDEDGNVACEYNYNGTDTSPYNVITSTYEKTAEGLLCTQDYSQSGGTAKAEMLLDESGRVLWSKYYNADGSCYSWSDCTYDSAGRLVQDNSYDGEGRLKQGWLYEYDQYGNIISFIAYGDSPDDIWNDERYEYVYGEDGKILEKRVYEDGELVGTIIVNYSYYESGAVELVQNIGDDGFNNILYYDEDGNLLKNVIHDYNNDVYTMRIENTYDEHGNLLTQKCWNEDELYDWREFSYVKVRK